MGDILIVEDRFLLKEEKADSNYMDALRHVSLYAVPVVFLIILFAGACKEVKVYDVFIEGAREGITTVIKIIPALVGLITAVGVFKASGALDILVFILEPISGLLGIPSGAMPLALMRPVSGSASLALLSDLLGTYGADSYTGRVVSTMMGSTETIFYTLTVYFGSIGVKNIRFTLIAALAADTVSVVVSAWACAMIFGR